MIQNGPHTISLAIMNNIKSHISLLKDKADVFKCGISTAPPTDWLFYDTMYTERFMRLPTEEDNWSGYEQASLLNKVNKIFGYFSDLELLNSKSGITLELIQDTFLLNFQAESLRGKNFMVNHGVADDNVHYQV